MTPFLMHSSIKMGAGPLPGERFSRDSSIVNNSEHVAVLSSLRREQH